jgi:WD40-like Beta Propeller Repeat
MIRDRLLLLGLTSAAVGASRCTAFKEDPSPAEGGPPFSQLDSGTTPDSGEGLDGGGGSHVDGSCDPNAPFGEAVPLQTQFGEVTLASAIQLRLSASYHIGYFSAQLPDGGTGMFTATRSAVDAEFTAIGRLPGQGLDAPDEQGPTVTGDGLTLAFSRSYPSGVGTLQYASRADSSAPFDYLGIIPNLSASTGQDQTPFFREDGRVLYFASSRVVAQQDDIYRSDRDGASYEMPAAVTELNSPFSDIGPAVTPDDLTIYFASDRPGPDAQGNRDIYVATRASSSLPFSRPRAVAELNTPGADVPSFVTRDNCTLYFYSDRDRAPFWIYVATKPAE